MRKKDIIPVVTMCIGCVGIGVGLGIMMTKKLKGGRI